MARATCILPTAVNQGSWATCRGPASTMLSEGRNAHLWNASLRSHCRENENLARISDADASTQKLCLLLNSQSCAAYPHALLT